MTNRFMALPKPVITDVEGITCGAGGLAARTRFL